MIHPTRTSAIRTDRQLTSNTTNNKKYTWYNLYNDFLTLDSEVTVATSPEACTDLPTRPVPKAEVEHSGVSDLASPLTPESQVTRKTRDSPKVSQ